MLGEALARCPTLELVPGDPVQVAQSWEQTARALEGIGAQLELARAGLASVSYTHLDGSDPQTVPGSEGASHPTIWGEEVAWVSGNAKVMISRWNGSDRRTLPGVPHRRCYYKELVRSPRLVCEAPQLPEVEALQLYRGQLALVDTFILNDNVGTVGTTTEVRTEAITGGPQRLIALLGVGEGDESWLGPSWSNGKDVYKRQLLHG